MLVLLWKILVLNLLKGLRVLYPRTLFKDTKKNNSKKVEIVREKTTKKVEIVREKMTEVIVLEKLTEILPIKLVNPYPEYSLCFPSISTTAYKFDLDKASTIACQVIGEFLASHKDPRIKLFLVDITESPTLDIFRKKAPADKRMVIQAVSITALKEEGIPCHYIVNASNPKFEGGGSGTNRAIHEACDDGSFRIFQIVSFGTPSLENLSKKLYKQPAEVGVAYPVDLVPGMPLLDKQGVRTVIHVVGPNMSPKRANYLNGDYEKGSELLRKSYTSILDAFYKKTGLPL